MSCGRIRFVATMIEKLLTAICCSSSVSGLSLLKANRPGDVINCRPLMWTRNSGAVVAAVVAAEASVAAQTAQPAEVAHVAQI